MLFNEVKLALHATLSLGGLRDILSLAPVLVAF
jgi:hypothetical protein